MSDDQGNQPSGGDAGTERALTADIHALRVDVAALVGRSNDAGLTQVLERFDALESRIDALSARLESQPSSHQQLLEDLQDNLADVASGEVVGALWDEVRQLRAEMPDAIAVPEPPPVAHEPDPQLGLLTDELAVLRSELAEGLVVEPSDALSASLDALRGEVDGLRDALSEMRSVPEPVAAPAVDDGRDERLLEQLGALRASVDEVHARLEEGLVLADDVEAPSDDAVGRADVVAAVVDIVGDQVAALRGFLSGELDAVRQTVTARLDGGAEETAAAVATASSTPDPGDDRFADQLAEIRSAIEEVRARLDDVAVATTEPDQGVLAGDPPGGADLEAIADQVAALRDFVASELDTRQQTVVARLDAAAEATAASVAESAARPAPEPAPASTAGGLDPDTVELLRDEIRASGAIGDQVVDALREELKALRRRIAVKASERVLDDQQLAQIADAVAARLAADGRDA